MIDKGELMKMCLKNIIGFAKNFFGLVLLLFSFSMEAQSTCPCSSADSSCLCMQPEKLFLSDIETHGAPVKAVDWLCSGTDNVYAAIGGILAASDARDFRIYENQDCQLSEVQNIDELHGATVLTVGWCVIDSDIYLAIGGEQNTVDPNADNVDVRIYRFNPANTADPLDLIVSYTHGAAVRSLAWLCDDCNSGSARYLAIGGVASNVDGVPARVLKFDSSTGSISTLTNVYHGAKVYSVDWNSCAGKLPLLAIGGEVYLDENVTIRLFTFNCATESLQQLTNIGGTGNRIDAVKMCCDSKGNLYLVAGGTHVDGVVTNPNIFLYQLNRDTCMLTLLSTANPTGEVFALDFIPSCNCTHFVAGLGCAADVPNIIVYQRTRNSQLRQVTSMRYDTNITSAQWCETGDCSCLLVGSEIDGYGSPCVEGSKEEIATFKGIFCLIQPPTIICKKKECRRYPTQANLVDIFCWNPVARAVRYEIYADMALKSLITTVSSGQQLCFCKYGVSCSPSTYYLVAIDGSGNMSEVVKVIVS